MAKPEEAVKKLRTHLHQAEAATLNGDALTAQQAAQEAKNIIEGLLKRLGPRFDKYKWQNFSRQPMDTQADAASEMVLQVCRGLKDLSDRPRAKYFETNFNAAVESCIYDAIRIIWREQERDTQRRAPVSLYEPLADIDGENSPEHLVDQIEDQSALDDVNNALGKEIVAQLLQQLPSRRHAEVLVYRMSGHVWDEVAAKMGVSEKTARNYFKTAESLLKQLLQTTA